jgi:geranylgeranyl pyrophosphate synthase
MISFLMQISRTISTAPISPSLHTSPTRGWSLSRILCRKYGIITATLDRARHYGARAKDALAGLPESAAKTILIDMVDFAIARAF